MSAFVPESSPLTTLTARFEQTESHLLQDVQRRLQHFHSQFALCPPTWHFDRQPDSGSDTILGNWKKDTQNLEILRFLGAGIAHDFSNLLTIMLGNLELVKLSRGQSEPYPILQDLEAAVNMARELNEQLAALFRGGTLNKEAVSLPELLEKATRLSLSGEKIECHFKFAPDLPLVPLDRCQINQVITNLVLNAVQAMPTGGRIEVAADTLELAQGKERMLPAGNYVQIKVQDSGIGMTAEQMSFIFAPHFTTKPSGKGLGLALCYTIIKRHNGQITVESQPGAGTTFRLLLPLN